MALHKLILIAAICLLNSACGGLMVPHVGSVKNQTMCGGVPDECQPQTVPYYQLYGNGSMTFKGDPKEYIGKKFKDKRLRETLTSCFEATEETHFKDPYRNQFTVKIEEKYLAQFTAQAKANVADSATHAATIKANVVAELSKYGTAEATVAFTMYSPPAAWLDLPGVRNCLAGMSSDENVILGLSTTEVSDIKWTSGATSKTVAELTAAVKERVAETHGLDASASAQVEAAVQRAFVGAMKSFSYAYAIGYAKKPKP